MAHKVRVSANDETAKAASSSGLQEADNGYASLLKTITHTMSTIKGLSESFGSSNILSDIESSDNNESPQLATTSSIVTDHANDVVNVADLSSTTNSNKLGEMLLTIALEALNTAIDSANLHRIADEQQEKEEEDCEQQQQLKHLTTDLPVANERQTSGSADSTSDQCNPSEILEKSRGTDVKIGAKKLRITSGAQVVHALLTDSVVSSMDDLSSQDEDSEPILDLLFKEQQHDFFESKRQNLAEEGGQIATWVDPAIDITVKFLSVATNILDFINNCFVSTERESLLCSHLKKNLSEIQLRLIAEIIKITDQNFIANDLYNDFTKALTTLTQNLLAMKLFDNDDNDLEKTNKFLGLIAVAETVLTLTLNQTATEPCDKIKLNFVDFCTLLTASSNLNIINYHTQLLPYTVRWLEMCRKYLLENQVFAQQLILESTHDRIKMVLDTTCCLLDYINAILDALNFLSSISSSKISDIDTQELQGNNHIDWMEEGPCFNIGDDDDESLVDDSDDESLCNKLCTFTLTQQDFVNQHWYHCHTCNMVDRVGVCSVCAKVCHRDHDLSYAKYGAFFCDCAGRENSTCMALVKRAPMLSTEDTNHESSRQIIESDQMIQDGKLDAKSNISSNQGNARESNGDLKKTNLFQQQLAQHIEPFKEELSSVLLNSDVCSITSNLLTSLIPAYVKFAHNESHVGRSKRARAALEELHSSTKAFYMTDALMLPTLGSQEGAFENVRVSYSGEHASLIKQLLNNGTLRRVAMTSLSSPLGKRQHLVVCHEKGRITLLQLNALLRQADSSKRKLTLTRLASAPIPFSVISIVANPSNEDVLAVCGLKDCHILTFTNNGLVSSHIELNLDLANATDHIIKAVWIPGGQTEIAVLTSDVVKIFDLSENSLEPKYHLKLAFGQLKDITFIVPESKSMRYILIMDTAGHIFQQELESSASNMYGLFYVTSELQLPHPALEEQDNCIKGGGISIYYSHSFKMLFFSFAKGNFMASLTKPTEVTRVFSLEFELSNAIFSSSSPQVVTYASVTAASHVEDPTPTEESSSADSKNKLNSSKTVQPLCQWSEVPGHVGLIMAVCLHSNNPVILMIRPECVFAQEIRYLSIKSRITDATAIRHTTSSGEVRTTLILLCEDGSLRIYIASQELTDFWLKMSLNSSTSLEMDSYCFLSKSSKKKKICNKAVKKSTNNSATGTSPVFQVDFFENLQLMNDIDFSGHDVLSIYSIQQLKNRLNNAGMYIACTKPSGFSIDVINNDVNMVICGIRIQVGSLDLTKTPSSIEIFGRVIQINPQTPRWYDIPLTREESLQTEKRLTIAFGPSADPNGITTVDSIRAYGKTKESFSWPEDGEEQVNSVNVAGEDLFSIFMGQESGSRYQKLLIHSMESLDCCLNLNLCQNLDRSHLVNFAKELSTSLLTVPYSMQVLKTIKSLLLTIYQSRQNYNQHRDSAALEFVRSSIESFKDDQIDGELFTRVVLIIKTLCQSKLSNLTKLSECLSSILEEKDSNLANPSSKESTKISQLIRHLHELFWSLYSQSPANISLASVASCGFINYEDTLQPLIELIYIATLYDLSVLPVATDVIIGFLLSKDLSISLCARQTLIRLLRIKGLQSETNESLFDQDRSRQQHLMLLEKFIEHLPDTRFAGGFRSISLLHAILVLTLDLDCDNEVDDAILKKLLDALKQELLWNTSQPELLLVRNPTNEVKLVIMRMFSILMSKVRTSSVASAVSSATRAETDSCWSTFCSSMTVQSLIDSDVLDFCYNVLKNLVVHWKTAAEINPNQSTSPILGLSNEPIVSVNRRTLPKSTAHSQIPDLSPFFLRQYVKGHGFDLFEDYTQLLTEMILRIPYQIKKVSSSSSNNLKPVVLSNDWSTILCEYLMIPIPSFIKKHVRKLLTFICGSKEKYRQLRDFHFLESHMKCVKTICGHSEEDPTPKQQYDTSDEGKSLALNYEAMTSLVEHLKSCIEIAQNRCINWQVYCLLKDQGLLPFMMKMSLNFCDDVASIILELLQQALSSSQLAAEHQNMSNLLDTLVITTTDQSVITDQTLRDTLTSESLGANLAQQLITSISKDLLSKFTQSFLLETNLTSLRWQTHNLLYNLWLNFKPSQQLEMVWVLWSLWHNLPKYGRKASQFVDLVGFVTLKSPQCSTEYDRMFCQEAINVLRQQNQLLTNHPNTHIYSSIQGLVDLDAYYLEGEPCSVCNSPEVAYNNVKLSSVKVDSRFTTTTQIIKLIGSHTILKFSLRISDIKRSKMVKIISIYYNNRSVQSVVELKNKTGIWNLARKYPLSPGQTEVKIEFTLPIVACNLMIEFSEFYENFQASSETLQCPRCSTSVSANPGVCGNCGENVFQCHKCRAINYDEKDPFLCISCGFCKYARFDISLTAKPTCAVDPIENEEDRKKTVASISNLLEKADKVYKNLMQNKPILELLLLRIHEQVMPDRQLDDNIIDADQGTIPMTSSIPNAVPPSSLQAQSIVVGYAPASVPSVMASSVNKAIQHLAQKYCVECKTLFEELSKITHKVLASRRELVEYDNWQLRRCLKTGSSVLSSANRRKSRVYSSLSSGSGRCYGCATATVEHCVTMLKALSSIYKHRTQICESGIINELVNFNLKNGSNTINHEVRQLLCSLTRDDLNSTTILTDLLMGKIAAISKQDYQPFEIAHIVRHEIALLAVTLESDDQCWELRLRCLIRIFAFAFELKNPTVMECLIIPCLKLLLSIIRPPVPVTRRHKDKSLENIASVRSDNFRSRVLLQEWLNNPAFVFEDWRKQAARPASLTQVGKQMKPITSILRRPSKVQYRTNYLTEKYGNRWRMKCSKYNTNYEPIATLPNDWLKRLLFNRASKTVRLRAKSLIEALFSVQARRKEIIDLLTSYLDEIGPAGECAQEFYVLYKNIIMTDHWRYYLALKGILIKIANLITIEIDNLQELEETTLNSSLSLGYSLKMLLELLTSIIAVPKIRSYYKSKLVGFVLKGYLSLRKLVVQRTKVIDETQEMLLELLEGMTTGSESETAAFINVCVESIKNCHESDIRTPVFIFERLCSTIHPEENVHSEFFVSLEKDPQQEDYLQGRMLGNPYSSNEAGIGPLMKDIKNKICQDCELIALLEDDSSMELLVSNKIISLDLPVRDVYKRIWCPENHETDAMRIVYRMRGLLGDATEEFIESFDSRNNEEIDEEQAYKMANVMSSSGGLKIMLHRLKQIDDLSPPFKPLLDVILKLFTYCTKTMNNRIKLLSPDLKTVVILLNTVRLALNEDDFLELAGLPKGVLGQELMQSIPATKHSVTSAPNPRTRVVDQILELLEIILREASKTPKTVFQKFCSETCGTIEDVKFLLIAAQVLCSRLPHVSHKIIQVLPFLTLGDRDKMSVLIDYFKPSIDFDRFDQEHSALNDSSIDLFCIMVDAIERNENGNQLKDFIVSERVIANSMKYLTTHAPPLKSSLLATSEEWKEFTSRPALKYVLRILGGLSQGHVSTQILISRECIPIVHGLEQVSSDARVGTLAENLLEAIKQHPSVAEKIELVRRQTKEEKKRLAMAVRERQLGALGMKANERGQVTAKSKLLEQCQDLAEDTGLICNICREGYKFQPTKVLGIYTYTKRCVLDEFEMKPRKSYGYTTVTHFNTVHVECHMSAVRSARSRDEWDSAALQNANTRCNGLLPIWGLQIPESAYANALARHNSYLQDSTGCRDIGYHSTVHDIRLQLLRFAQERSFSEDTGGGGPQSNLHLLPYMMQTALYVLNSTKTATREYKRVLNYLEMSSNEILENCYDVDSPYYWSALAVLVLPPMWWRKKRTEFLLRLLICNHVRRVNVKPPAPISDTRTRAYSYYKSALIYFAFIDSFYNIVFKDAVVEEKWNQDWSITLADYLKHNDQTVNDNIEVLLNLYQNSLLTCTSMERFFEIVRINEISQPNEFLTNALESV